MRMSQRSRVAGWSAAALLLALVLVGALVLSRGAFTRDAHAAEENELGLGVVDLEALMQAHPEAERLQQLDQQIALLQQELELVPIKELTEKQREGQEQMRSALEKSRKELETESNRLTAELEGLSAAMAQQLQAEGDALQEHYQRKLQQEIGELQPAELGKNAEQRMQDFLADLQMVLNQRLTAKRLELEKQVQARLEGERQRVDAELAAYEDELMRQNQQRKLNLQLEMQVVEDPEKEAELQAQLAELGDAEHAAKEARRAELYGQLDTLGAEEKAALEGTLSAYERDLKAEVQQKAAAERNRLAGMPAPSGATPPDIEKRIAEIRATITAEMETRKSQMQAQMEAKQEEARVRLQAKQKQVEERLNALAKQIREVLESAQDDVSEPTREKMKALEAQIEQALAERQKLFESMKADLAEKVGPVARKAGVHSVVGAFVVNVDLPDLTDQAMVALKNAPAGR